MNRTPFGDALGRIELMSEATGQVFETSIELAKEIAKKEQPTQAERKFMLAFSKMMIFGLMNGNSLTLSK